MKPLPNFADLMLLPRVVDPHAVVNVRDHRIFVRSGRIDELLKQFAEFPHVNLFRIGEGEVRLDPVLVNATLILVSWPSGERRGLAVYPDNWFAALNADALDHMVSAGITVRTLLAREHESIHDIIQRLKKTLL